MTVQMETLLTRERRAKQICAELNHFTDLRDTLLTVVRHVKEISGCESVALRLHHEDDFPYFVYDGFSDSFIHKESSLCSRDKLGEPLVDHDGELQLDCMCGNVIRGKIDLRQPFFTGGGSFWSNNTSSLLAETSEEDRQGSTRNHCNAVGYESVALIPIRARDEILGLIQLNDKQVGRFTRELIEYMEMIGRQIGLAVHNGLAHEQLKLTKQHLEQRTEQLARSNADLEVFAHAASHDLREPLRVITSFATLLRRKAAHQCPQDALEYLDLIDSSAQTMEELIAGMLEYARLDAEPHVEYQVNLNEVMDRVLRDLGPLIEESGARVEAEDLPSVLGDAQLLQRVVQNLISNAIKYRRPDAPAVIWVRAQAQPDCRVGLEVQDNGLGIEERFLEQIFEPFRRLHTRQEVEGSGLGLSICRRIAQRLGGEMIVQSTPGRGSTFITVLRTA